MPRISFLMWNVISPSSPHALDSNRCLSSSLNDVNFHKIVSPLVLSFPDTKANSFVGTAEYVSPELLTDKIAYKRSVRAKQICISPKASKKSAYFYFSQPGKVNENERSKTGFFIFSFWKVPQKVHGEMAIYFYLTVGGIVLWRSLAC